MEPGAGAEPERLSALCAHQQGGGCAVRER